MTGGRRSHLYIGSWSDAKDRKKLEKWGVRYILNVSPPKTAGIQVCCSCVGCALLQTIDASMKFSPVDLPSSLIHQCVAVIWGVCSVNKTISNAKITLQNTTRIFEGGRSEFLWKRREFCLQAHSCVRHIYFCFRSFGICRQYCWLYLQGILPWFCTGPLQYGAVAINDCSTLLFDSVSFTSPFADKIMSDHVDPLHPLLFYFLLWLSQKGSSVPSQSLGNDQKA